MNSSLALKRVCAALVACAFIAPAVAQTVPETRADLPVTKVSLFSSGVGYFEHASRLSGSVVAVLPFDVEAVNDALKSLVVTDPAGGSVSVSYPSEETLERTLKSLKVDLSGNPGISDLLAALRGAEIRVSAAGEISGRIVGVETREGTGNRGQEAFLSILTASGIRVVALSEISSFAFADRALTADLARALDLILSSRDLQTRNLEVHLPGKGERQVLLGYVVPAPVWKASYRLDLSGEVPRLQGWAIVDNAGNIDWNGVSLTLVTGRPVSFIQNLYGPLRLERPVLPLSIAGVAQAETYESGYGNLKMAEEASPAPAPSMQRAERPAAMSSKSLAYDESYDSYGEREYALAGSAFGTTGAAETTVAKAAGDQFAFTLKKPVTLARQQSAMIPLVEAGVKADKVSVFSGDKTGDGASTHPMLCAWVTNTSGMKLPAGPITVFDGGSYAGDALVEFFPENDRRLIAFGEDLAVSGFAASSSERIVTGVTVSRGVMTVSRRTTWTRTYTFHNADSKGRRLVVEHPVREGTELAQPKAFEEKTAGAYRLSLDLAANGDATLAVKEESPARETVILSQLGRDAIVYYSSSKDMPAKVRDALARAVELKKAADDADSALSDLQNKRENLVSEQDRIRQNVEAAGNTSSQGKEYLKRLAAADAEIDALDVKIDASSSAAKDRQNAYEAYLSGLSLE